MDILFPEKRPDEPKDILQPEERPDEPKDILQPEEMPDEPKDILQPEERLDDLNRNDYKIIQNPNKFCFGMDAVLLSHFARAGKNDRVIDLGTGTGVIPILMESMGQGRHFTALEIQTESADMAERSVRYNGLEDKINIVTGDIKEASQIFGRASFDVVTTNPPYMNDMHGLKNPELPKAIARHEVMCTLEDVIRESSLLLKPAGHFYMVHRPFRLVEIFELMRKYKLEPKRMTMVHSYVDKEPTMVLIEGTRGGRSMIKITKPLIIYREPGLYSQDVLDIYEK